ncbi:hypothetical protein BX600DRAFT_528622 [Xylariales sp. PMI_506]|nr:hypothetical protein BX600DRAFT_528622 [Xylariales sp. PMI_506]
MAILTRRPCSPYEARLAIREHLGYYNAATVGAIYEFDDAGLLNLRDASSWIEPLKRCIREHPSMAITVKDRETEKPFYEFIPTLDLQEHITILKDTDGLLTNGHPTSSSKSYIGIIEKFLPTILDRNFSRSSSPPWGLIVLPLPPASGSLTIKGERYFVAFLSSHSISDGGAGFAFHKSLLDALREQRISGENGNAFLVTVPIQPIPDPFDTPERLPVTPEFLKAAAAAGAAGGAVGSTWTGAPVFLRSKESLQTRVRLLEIDAPLVQGALATCKRHKAKLTATFHQLVVRALSTAVTDADITSFSSQTAIDLRGAAGAGYSQWGIYVSGVSDTHPRWSGAPNNGQIGANANGSNKAGSPLTPEEWTAAARLSQKLAEASLRLENQPIGMLKFVPNHRQSMTSKLGSARDGSYSVSNMLAFDAGNSGGVTITNMVVSSSAAVPSAPLSFCLVSVKGGSLMVAVNWQPGALGIVDTEEDEFISEIFRSLEADFKMLSQETE